MLNLNYRKMLKENKQRIIKFAERNKLPVLEIDGQARPIIGSGLWNPLPYLFNEDLSDCYETNKAVGFGHIVWRTQLAGAHA